MTIQGARVLKAPFPALDAEGYLPAGVHPATLEEVISRFGDDTQKEALTTLYRQSCEAGVDRIVLAGSYVTGGRRCIDIDGILYGPADANWGPVLDILKGSRVPLDFFVVHDVAALRTLIDLFGRRRDGKGQRGLIDVPIPQTAARVFVSPQDDAVIDYQIRKAQELADRSDNALVRQAMASQIAECKRILETNSPQQFYKECLRAETALPAVHGKGDLQINSVIGLVMAEQRPFKLVDIGCGQGRLMQELATLDPSLLKLMHYVGVDKDLTAVRATCERLRFRAHCGRVEFLGLEEHLATLSGTADYVFLMNVTHEIPVGELGLRAAEWMALLKMPGYLIIHDMEHLVHGERNYVPWRGDEIRDLLTAERVMVTVRQHASKSGVPLFTCVAAVTGQMPSGVELTQRCLSLCQRKEEALIRERAALVGRPGQEREYAYLSVAIANVREQLTAIAGRP